MENSGGFSAADDPAVEPSGAGTIKRIRLENFMCHSNLQIELGRWVNFITGQNGSGKSAILTALCIAFGCRAKDTQRASRLKDFIKTGCSHAIVEVEVRNEGADAYKYEIYGNTIIIDRRISESTSSIVLKDHQGKKVSGRRDELHELVEHFNIDVENPCVIMSQDRSREFLHSGNDKDKFKFFYRASLLQQVDELLQNIGQQVNNAYSLVEELERSIKPVERELDELQLKIKNMEHLEKISQEAKQLKKKLAWSWVFNFDKQMEEQRLKIEKLEARRPRCQARIDSILNEVELLRDRLSKKKAQFARLRHDMDEAKRRESEMKQELASAMRRKLELELEHGREENNLQKMATNVKKLEQQVKDIEEQYLRNTQAENSEIEERIKAFEEDFRISKSTLSRLQDEERALLEYVSKGKDEMRMISEEIDRLNKEHYSIQSQIKEFQLHQTNKVTAFGGGRVLHLLQAIERHHLKFSRPPIGPIGAHLTLVDKKWACAVENALGKLLNAFIVTNHKDLQTLKACAKEAHYNYLQIFIYDFARQRLTIPNHMRPQTNCPTTLSVLQSDNHTILNVLVDMGGIERQVLVDDYDAGKALAFDRRIPNLKEVYTSEGRRMFSRNSVQTVLPPNKKPRDARLHGSFDDQINNLVNEKSKAEEVLNDNKKRKREAEEKLNGLQSNLQSLKRRCSQAERECCAKEMALKDAKESRVSEASLPTTLTTDELSLDISRIKERIKEKDALLEKLRYTMSEAEKESENLKLSFEKICESTNEETNAWQNAQEDERKIELQIKEAEKAQKHYEDIMKDKVLSEIKVAEQEFQELEAQRKESSKKASIICPESEIEALGGWDGATPEQLSAKLDRLNQRLQHENQQCSESIDDLRMIYEKKERKILKKRQHYRALHEKLDACKHALDLRWNKFRRNAKSLRLGLTLNFNCNLGRKGISGHINVDYEKKTLSVEVTMPQDASGNAVHDTRGLSGGERSFSTLCFALALHQMTEAPFRAMDEFDVFMDAVSRKISLETLMEFALEQKSQWIFITPHDISMVKSHERVKKQQMAAPRP